nr:protein BOLA2 [Malus domestica]
MGSGVGLKYSRPSRISDLSRFSQRQRVVSERKLRREREKEKEEEEEMGVTKEQVKSSLTSKLNPAHLEVIDTSGGCGASFAIEIVSEQFEGKRLLERHRLVNSSLEEEMKEIHALSIKKALTPEQWKQQQESQVSKPAA